MEKHSKILKEATKKNQDQIDLSIKACDSEIGGNKTIQIVDSAMDDPGILAGKTFSVTSGIFAKGVLINQRG